MRTRLFIIVVVALIISMFQNTISVTAIEPENQIDILEAKQLIFKAWYLCSVLRYGDISYLDEYGNRVQFQNTDYYLCDESKLPGGSYENMKEYAKSIYTEDVSHIVYSKLYSDNSIDMFKTDDNNLYWASDSHRNIDDTSNTVIPRFYLSCGKYTRFYDYVNSNCDIIEAVSEMTLEIVQSDESEVIVRVLLEYNPKGFSDAYIYTPTCWVDCILSKTDDGWRISGGNYVNALNDAFNTQYTTVYSPSTADPNVSRVWWLAGVSLAALVPAALLVRRRRREE